MALLIRRNDVALFVLHSSDTTVKLVELQGNMQSSQSSQTGQVDYGLNALELGKAYDNVDKQQGTLSMGAGKPIPPSLPDSNEYVVDFDGPDDPAHPLNWSFTVKYVCLVIGINKPLLTITIIGSISHQLFASGPSQHLSPAQSSPQVPLMQARPSESVPRLAHSAQPYTFWALRPDR